MEIKKLQQAKTYIDKLITGVDPFTDKKVTIDTLYSNETIACLQYVSAILDENIRFIERGDVNTKPKRGRKILLRMHKSLYIQILIPYWSIDIAPNIS